MEKQYLQFSDGAMIGCTKRANGQLEIDRDDIPVGRVQVWPAPADDASEGTGK